MEDPEAVEDLVRAEQPGMAADRLEYLYRQAPERNPRLTEELQELYDGRCQICQWQPRSQYGANRCHGHHIQWLSRGGEDRLENMALICPNHHSAIHRIDAPLDYLDLAFDFGSHRERVTLNEHLGIAG